ncbi:hypothetical protein DIPPA_10377 [Diplonema papillatum]|nr:hypothetical protein DIPPA_10377 [Diplonema papillatum]
MHLRKFSSVDSTQSMPYRRRGSGLSSISERLSEQVTAELEDKIDQLTKEKRRIQRESEEQLETKEQELRHLLEENASVKAASTAQKLQAIEEVTELHDGEATLLRRHSLRTIRDLEKANAAVRKSNKRLHRHRHRSAAVLQTSATHALLMRNFSKWRCFHAENRGRPIGLLGGGNPFVTPSNHPSHPVFRSGAAANSTPVYPVSRATNTGQNRGGAAYQFVDSRSGRMGNVLVGADGKTVLDSDEGKAVLGPDGRPVELDGGRQRVVSSAGDDVLLVSVDAGNGRLRIAALSKHHDKNGKPVALRGGGEVYADSEGILRLSDGRIVETAAGPGKHGGAPLLSAADGRVVVRRACDGRPELEDGSPIVLQGGRPFAWSNGSVCTVGTDLRTVLGADGAVLLGNDSRPLVISKDGRACETSGLPVDLSAYDKPANASSARHLLGADGRSVDGVAVAPDGRTLLGPDGRVVLLKGDVPVEVVQNRPVDAEGRPVRVIAYGGEALALVPRPDGLAMGSEAPIYTDRRGGLRTESGVQLYTINGAVVRAADGRVVVHGAHPGTFALEDATPVVVGPSNEPHLWGDRHACIVGTDGKSVIGPDGRLLRGADGRPVHVDGKGRAVDADGRPVGLRASGAVAGGAPVQSLSVEVVNAVGVAPGELYVEVALGDGRSVRTKACGDGKAPGWYETFRVPFARYSEGVVAFTLKDERAPDATIGRAEVTVTRDLLETGKQTLQLTPTNGGRNAGYLTVAVKAEEGDSFTASVPYVVAVDQACSPFRPGTPAQASFGVQYDSTPPPRWAAPMSTSATSPVFFSPPPQQQQNRQVFATSQTTDTLNLIALQPHSAPISPRYPAAGGGPVFSPPPGELSRAFCDILAAPQPNPYAVYTTLSRLSDAGHWHALLRDFSLSFPHVCRGRLPAAIADALRPTLGASATAVRILRKRGIDTSFLADAADSTEDPATPRRASSPPPSAYGGGAGRQWGGDGVYSDVYDSPFAAAGRFDTVDRVASPPTKMLDAAVVPRRVQVPPDVLARDMRQALRPRGGKGRALFADEEQVVAAVADVESPEHWREVAAAYAYAEADRRGDLADAMAAMSRFAFSAATRILSNRGVHLRRAFQTPAPDSPGGDGVWKGFKETKSRVEEAARDLRDCFDRGTFNERAAIATLREVSSASEWDGIAARFSLDYPELHGGDIERVVAAEMTPEAYKTSAAILRRVGVRLPKRQPAAAAPPKAVFARRDVNRPASNVFRTPVKPPPPPPSDSVDDDFSPAAAARVLRGVIERGEGTDDDLYAVLVDVPSAEGWDEVSAEYAKARNGRGLPLAAALAGAVHGEAAANCREILAKRGVALPVDPSRTQPSGFERSGRPAAGKREGGRAGGRGPAEGARRAGKHVSRRAASSSSSSGTASERSSESSSSSSSSSSSDDSTPNTRRTAASKKPLKASRNPASSRTVVPLPSDDATSAGPDKENRAPSTHGSVTTASAASAAADNPRRLACRFFDGLKGLRPDVPALHAAVAAVPSPAAWPLVVGAFAARHPTFSAGDLPRALEEALPRPDFKACRKIAKKRGFDLSHGTSRGTRELLGRAGGAEGRKGERAAGLDKRLALGPDGKTVVSKRDGTALVACGGKVVLLRGGGRLATADGTEVVLAASGDALVPLIATKTFSSELLPVVYLDPAGEPCAAAGTRLLRHPRKKRQLLEVPKRHVFPRRSPVAVLDGPALAYCSLFFPSSRVVVDSATRLPLLWESTGHPVVTAEDGATVLSGDGTIILGPAKSLATGTVTLGIVRWSAANLTLYCEPVDEIRRTDRIPPRTPTTTATTHSTTPSTDSSTRAELSPPASPARNPGLGGAVPVVREAAPLPRDTSHKYAAVRLVEPPGRPAVALTATTGENLRGRRCLAATGQELAFLPEAHPLHPASLKTAAAPTHPYAAGHRRAASPANEPDPSAHVYVKAMTGASVVIDDEGRPVTVDGFPVVCMHPKPAGSDGASGPAGGQAMPLCVNTRPHPTVFVANELNQVLDLDGSVTTMEGSPVIVSLGTHAPVTPDGTLVYPILPVEGPSLVVFTRLASEGGERRGDVFVDPDTKELYTFDGRRVAKPVGGPPETPLRAVTGHLVVHAKGDHPGTAKYEVHEGGGRRVVTTAGDAPLLWGGRACVTEEDGRTIISRDGVQLDDEMVEEGLPESGLEVALREVFNAGLLTPHEYQNAAVRMTGGVAGDFPDEQEHILQLEQMLTKEVGRLKEALTHSQNELNALARSARQKDKLHKLLTEIEVEEAGDRARLLSWESNDWVTLARADFFQSAPRQKRVNSMDLARASRPHPSGEVQYYGSFDKEKYRLASLTSASTVAANRFSDPPGRAAAGGRGSPMRGPLEKTPPEQLIAVPQNSTRSRPESFALTPPHQRLDSSAQSHPAASRGHGSPSQFASQPSVVPYTSSKPPALVRKQSVAEQSEPNNRSYAGTPDSVIHTTSFQRVAPQHGTAAPRRSSIKSGPPPQPVLSAPASHVSTARGPQRSPSAAGSEAAAREGSFDHVQFAEDGTSSKQSELALDVGEAVTLTTSGETTGCLRKDEVGMITDVDEGCEMPYLVTGPRQDTFWYRSTDLTSVRQHYQSDTSTQGYSPMRSNRGTSSMHSPMRTYVGSDIVLDELR